ncbi:MAG: DNA polymerase IV [Bacteroidota bacterium]
MSRWGCPGHAHRVSGPRQIIHVDMDAFYASVEQRDHPEYRGKPIAVGYAGERGVVAAASYEARQFGVHSAMPSVTALRQCPDLIFVPHRFDVYKAVSRQIRGIFRQYTDLIEPLSLDEAYLDVTMNKKGMPSATLVAEEIRQRIREETELTASAGVSFNKFLAKVASDLNKPNGQAVITPEAAEAFLETLPIDKFFGIGKVTAAKMRNLGIHTGADLKQRPRTELFQKFGKPGVFYYHIVRGIDDRPVVAERVTKSVSAEHTYRYDLLDEQEILDKLQLLSEEVWSRCERAGLTGRTVTIKVKYHDFTQITRSQTQEQFLQDPTELHRISGELVTLRDHLEKPIRLLGVGLSNLNNEQRGTDSRQLTLEF